MDDVGRRVRVQVVAVAIAAPIIHTLQATPPETPREDLRAANRAALDQLAILLNLMSEQQLLSDRADR